MRILLATDQPQLGDALALYLSEGRCDVLAVASDTRELLALASTLRPEAIVCDWRLNGIDSAGALASLADVATGVPVVVLSTGREQARAREAGADCCVTFGDPPETLLDMLRAAVSDSAAKVAASCESARGEASAGRDHETDPAMRRRGGADGGG